MGVLFKARAVILTNGTFLNGLMHTGRASAPGGRAGDGVSYGLTEYFGAASVSRRPDEDRHSGPK